jgi:hypothetical protein
MITKEKIEKYNYKYTVIIGQDILEPLADEFGGFDLVHGPFDVCREFKFLSKFLSGDVFEKFITYIIGRYEGVEASLKSKKTTSCVDIDGWRIWYNISLDGIEIILESDEDFDVDNLDHETVSNDSVSEAIEDRLKEYLAKYIALEDKHEQVTRKLYPVFKKMLLVHLTSESPDFAYYSKIKFRDDFAKVVDDSASRFENAKYDGVPIKDIFEKLIEMFNCDDTHDYRYDYDSRGFSFAIRKV